MLKIISVNLLLVLFIYGDDIVLTSKESIILKTVMRVDGYIDEKLYNEFWEKLRRRITKHDMNKVRNFFLDNAMNIQVVLWNCFRESIVKKKACKSQEYVLILNQKKNNGDIVGYNNTINLMEAAITGKPFEKNGQKLYITIDMVDNVLMELNGSIQRTQQLLSDKWK